MFGNKERNQEMIIGEPKAKENHEKELEWSAVRAAQNSKMSQRDEVITAIHKDHIRAYEVGTGTSVEDSVESTHRFIIKAKRSGEEIVRQIHFQSEPIFGERVDPFSWRATVQEEDTVTQGHVNKIVRIEPPFRRGTIKI